MRDYFISSCVFAPILFPMCLCNFSLFNLFDFGNSRKISDEMDNIQMIFYEGSPKNEISHSYMLDQTEDLMTNIDLKKPFVLYIHGFEEYPTNESVQTIVSVHLKKGTDNIVILDWSSVASHTYVYVTMKVKEVAKRTAKAIQNLVSLGLDVDNLHVVGHSLGAQVAGFIGRYLNFTIPRVTGLDPANPLFYQFGAEHIDEKSGDFVDIIHTDGGIYGAYDRTGTVDFYPNGGTRAQPGCRLFGIPLSPRSLCSHWMSWRIYAESVVNETAFPALRCESYYSFVSGGCQGNKIVYYGYSVPRNISGVYYFLTNDKSPFGKGLLGIKFIN